MFEQLQNFKAKLDLEPLYQWDPDDKKHFAKADKFCKAHEVSTTRVLACTPSALGDPCSRPTSRLIQKRRLSHTWTSNLAKDTRALTVIWHDPDWYTYFDLLTALWRMTSDSSTLMERLAS